MRNILIISLLFIIFSCNNTKQEEIKEEVKEEIKEEVKEEITILDFPPISTFADSVIYFGCEDILSRTPESFNFIIYKDTVIDLHHFDNRLDISLKFNWLYEGGIDNWPKTIGVASIDMLQNNKIMSNINLKEILEVEAFNDYNPESKTYGQAVRDDIYMIDVNFDSYLDIKIRSSCGKACYYSYWTYNHEKELFEYDESLNYVRTYYVDCNNNLIYSYDGGSAWYYDSRAYKFDNGKIKLFQSVYYEYNVDYNLEIYRDASGSIIFADTTSK